MDKYKELYDFAREAVQFFRRSRLVDIYSAVSDKLSEAWMSNQAVNEEKLARLTSAYRSMMLTGVSVILFAVLYVVYVASGRVGSL